jgi:LytS/YehU family sensor histidine kinase
MSTSYLRTHGLRLFLKMAPFYMLITMSLNKILKPENTLFTLLTAFVLLVIGLVFCIALMQLIVYSYTHHRKIVVLLLYSVAFILFFVLLLSVLMPKLSVFKYLEIRGEITLVFIANLTLQYINALVMAGFIYYHISSKYHQEALLQAKEEAHQRELEAKEALHQKEIEAKELELAFLVAQINPHFLHNTLTAMQEDCETDNPEMAMQLNNLSDLMRYKLDCTKENKTKVSVSEELEALKAYLAILTWRFPNADVRFSTSGHNLGQEILPTAVLTIAENMFQHGVFRNGVYPVYIHQELHEAYIAYHFKNKIDPQSKVGKENGVGLANIRRRLELVFPDRHQLDVVIDEDDWFNVYLKINQ